MEHLLFEHSMGYGLFVISEPENIGSDIVGSEYEEFAKLVQVVKLKSFYRFDDVKIALESLQKIANGEIPEELNSFLEGNDVKIIYCDKSLSYKLKELGYKVKSSPQIIRGIRKNQSKLFKVSKEDVHQFRLALSHQVSKSKIEYNISREDNFVIQSFLTIEQLDKDINLYSMKAKEIYGWVFPELLTVLPEISNFIKAIKIMESNDFKLEDLKIFGENKFQEIKYNFENTIGSEISGIDKINLKRLIDVIDEKIKIKKDMEDYLHNKITVVAPNLSELLGDKMAAQLIEKAGGLLNLSKCPSSTLQVLGAEKALFRALKMKSSTPKYGSIFNTSCVQRAERKFRARLCRFLASKCSIASRIDSFGDLRTNEYGKALKDLVEKKIVSFKTGEEIERTDDVLEKVFRELKNIKEDKTGNVEKKKNKQKKKDTSDSIPTESTKKPKDKRKRKHAEDKKDEIQEKKSKSEDKDLHDDSLKNKSESKEKQKSKYKKSDTDKKLVNIEKSNIVSDKESIEKPKKKKRAHEEEKDSNIKNDTDNPESSKKKTKKDKKFKTIDGEKDVKKDISEGEEKVSKNKKKKSSLKKEKK